MRRALSAALAAALVCCRPAPAAPSRTLLFLDKSPAATLDGFSWAPDPDSSRIVAFDGALRLAKAFTHARLATPVAVARLGSDLLVSERTGQGIVFTTDGHPLREWESPDPADIYAAAGKRGGQRALPVLRAAALAKPTRRRCSASSTSLAGPSAGSARMHKPAAPFLTQLTNAGGVATDAAGAVYFAPVARDEIVKFDRTGATAWTASRGRFARETDPVIVARGREVDARYAVVNLALVLGPDGRLYALGGDDSAATRLRVDVLDTASGKILATRHLGPRETAVALDSSGQIETHDADSLLALLPSAGRERFEPPFALRRVQGDTVRLADFAGKVLLVNFWASWCHPCREEFPRMATLYEEFSRADFEIAAISDDRDFGSMLSFVTALRPPFPILVGGGRMRAVYHYRGLPYSVLLDRHGRIVKRIFGFGSEEEFRALRATIANEVRAP